MLEGDPAEFGCAFEDGAEAFGDADRGLVVGRMKLAARVSGKCPNSQSRAAPAASVAKPRCQKGWSSE